MAGRRRASGTSGSKTHKYTTLKGPSCRGTLGALAQTLTRILIYIVFSTKNRAEFITPEMEPQTYRYIGGVCRGAESPLLDAGGTKNHGHLLVSLSKNIALAGLLLQIKRDSTRWIKSNLADNFRWQEG